MGIPDIGIQRVNKESEDSENLDIAMGIPDIGIQRVNKESEDFRCDQGRHFPTQFISSSWKIVKNSCAVLTSSMFRTR